MYSFWCLACPGTDNLDLVAHSRCGAVLTSTAMAGQPITNCKSKLRNIWIRDVFCSLHLWCWGSQPKHISNPAQRSLNHIVCMVRFFSGLECTSGLPWARVLAHWVAMGTCFSACKSTVCHKSGYKVGTRKLKVKPHCVYGSFFSGLEYVGSDVYFGNVAQWTRLRNGNCIAHITCFTVNLTAWHRAV